MRYSQYQQLSSDIQRLAFMHHLGLPMFECEVSFSRLEILKIARNLLLLILCILAIFIGPNNIVSIYLGNFFYFLFCLTLLFGLLMYFLFSLWHSFHLYLTLDARLVVFTEGFIYIKKNISQVFYWNLIESIKYVKTKRYIRGKFVVKMHIVIHQADGTSLLLNDTFNNFEKLCEILNHQSLQFIFPNAIIAYRTGKSIAFGNLNLSQQGISKAKKILPWSQIDEIVFNKDRVIIRKKGNWLNWAKVSSSKIPNLIVLENLVNSIWNGKL